MIGNYIGLGIGTAPLNSSGLPFQNIDIDGFVLVSSSGECACSGSDDCEACYDISVVQGNDLLVRLTVNDLDGNPISLASVTDIRWSLYNANDSVILSKSLFNGITLEDKIKLVLTEEDLANLNGQYSHQFTLEFNGDSLATVVRNARLSPGSFFVRPTLP